MAKSKPFTEEDLKRLGMTETEPNVFKRVVKKTAARKDNRLEIYPGIFVKPEYLYSDDHAEYQGPDSKPKNNKALFCEDVKASISPAVSLDQVLTIEIPGIVPGLNGDKGLMRSHWSETKKMKKLYCQIIKDQLPAKYRFEGAVSIEYVGYKSSLMDWDNFCSSAKHILDSLVKCGVIINDNPKIVKEFLPKQVKCSRASQKVEVIIRNFKEK
jgi:Holliday junction resolvase RusA-like endonuclease